MIDDEALHRYERMYLIRTVEQRLLALYADGHISGTVHTCLGQEACAVGVISAIDRNRDVVWSNHRGHGHFIEMTDDVEGMIAEILGRATGVSGGVGGSQHLHGPGIFTNGVLGGTVACAVGSAFAEKLLGTGGLAVAFFGDGALGEGVVYESFNMAALWELPVLFVLENNRIAQSTPAALEHAGDLHARATPFGIETLTADGRSVTRVADAARRAVTMVREDSRPVLLALETYRLGPHSKGDDTRDPEDLKAGWQKDPVARARDDLVSADGTAVDEIEKTVAARVDAAIEAALAAPRPDPSGLVFQ